jgi:hypothetical protein
VQHLRHLFVFFDFKMESHGVTGDAVMADFARQMLEVVPSIRHTGGFTAMDTVQSIHVRMLHMDGSAIDDDLVPSPLIYNLWKEPPAAPALFCAHIAVVNSNTSSYAHFEFTIAGERPPAGDALQAKRIFTPGAWHSSLWSSHLNLGNNRLDCDNAGVSLNVSTAAGSADPVWLPARDYIAPGATNLYRIGCDLATAELDNLATNPTMEAPALAQMPGWAQAAYGDADPRVTMTSDTAVAAEGRHSVKIRVPSAKPIVFPLAGTEMVKPPADASWGSKHAPPAGTKVFSSSIILAPGGEFDLEPLDRTLCSIIHYAFNLMGPLLVVRRGSEVRGAALRSGVTSWHDDRAHVWLLGCA